MLVLNCLQPRQVLSLPSYRLVVGLTGLSYALRCCSLLFGRLQFYAGLQIPFYWMLPFPEFRLPKPHLILIRCWKFKVSYDGIYLCFCKSSPPNVLGILGKWHCFPGQQFVRPKPSRFFNHFTASNSFTVLFPEELANLLHF